jgi:hypothetical protein
MGRFDLRTETIHADWWDEDETVTVTELTYQQSIEISTAGISSITLADMPGFEVERRQGQQSSAEQKQIDMTENRLAPLHVGIASWTFKQNGKVIPVNSESIGKLSQRDGNFIMEAIERMNPSDDKTSDGEDFPVIADKPLPKRQGKTT